MNQGFDYLIVVTSGQTKDIERSNQEEQKQSTGNNLQNQLQEDNDSTEQLGRMIEFNWCIYDTKKQIVTEQFQRFIKGEDFLVNNETLTKNKITLSKFDGALLFSKLIQEFNDYTYTNFTRQNKSFCIVTYGDALMTRILPREAQFNQMKLASHFFTYFDIRNEFKKNFSHAISIKTLHEMLTYTNLQEKPLLDQSIASFEMSNIVRLVNMLVRSGYIFNHPKLINNSYQVVLDNQDSKTRYIQSREKKSKNNYVRGRSPEPFKNLSQQHFIRVRGLPYSAREPEIYELLKNIRIYKEDIAFLYDSEGKFSGEAYVRVYSQLDKQEALCYNLNKVEGRFVEIFETTENEFNRAKISQFPEKRNQDDELPNETQFDLNKIVTEGAGVVRIRGLPYSCTEEDIKKFFKGLTILQGGIKRAILGGRPGGECFVIFQTKDDAHKALNFHMEKIHNRFIEVFLATVKEFENYMAHNFVNSAPVYSKDNMPNIPPEKRKSTLMVMGMPFSVTKQKILEFFKGFEINEREIHLLCSHTGKFSGSALVTFEDELEAQRALKTKNFSYIENRYLELFEYK
ncbi:hypothetical protein ABPG74_020385 [Tetrahymena malaccensis]